MTAHSNTPDGMMGGGMGWMGGRGGSGMRSSSGNILWEKEFRLHVILARESQDQNHQD